MEKLKNEELLFPVDKSKADSLKQLSEKLQGMSSSPFVAEEKEETISDDFDMEPALMEKIKASENEMRDLLKSMGQDYDALIKMDGKSVYARAVAANPAILDFVKSSANPVLEAVKIAMGFKPYADFMEKYGSEPSEIIENVRKEIDGENMKEKKQKISGKSDYEQALNRPSFSHATKSIKEEKSDKVKTLEDIFKR